MSDRSYSKLVVCRLRSIICKQGQHAWRFDFEHTSSRAENVTDILRGPLAQGQHAYRYILSTLVMTPSYRVVRPYFGTRFISARCLPSKQNYQRSQVYDYV